MIHSQPSDDLSEDEFNDRLIKFAGETGCLKSADVVKGFSTALFKRTEKSIPSKRALQMLKCTKVPEIFFL